MGLFSTYMNMAKTAIMGSFLYIHNMYDFVDFAGNVNAGTSYFGTTVVLETDIDFSGYSVSLSPIGVDSEHSFMGTFDGKGHTLSNFKISTSSDYTGVFGYTQGATIRDLRVDSTCTISGNALGVNSYIGGIVGYCISTKESGCTIDGCMSAARVTFAGNDMHGFAGGLVGKCGGTVGKGCAITNSMSYGVVKHEGSSKMVRMGGVCGVCKVLNHEEAKCTIYNSGGYTILTQSGEVKEKLLMGGILGVGVNAEIENCATGSLITSTNDKRIAGAVAGALDTSNVTNVFWEKLHIEKSVSKEKPGRTVVDKASSSPSEFYEQTANALNRYKIRKESFFKAFQDKYKWILLRMNGGTVNGVTGDAVLALRNFVPVPRKAGERFTGWCENEFYDKECDKSPLASGSLSFYAKYTTDSSRAEKGKAAITFVISKTHSEEVVQTQGDTIKFPTPSMKGHSLVAWDPNLKKVPYGDVVIKALWDDVKPSPSSSSSQLSDFTSTISPANPEEGSTNILNNAYIAAAAIVTLLVVCLSLCAFIPRRKKEPRIVVIRRKNRIERINSYYESGKSIWNVINPFDVNDLYPNGLPSQSLEDALTNAGYAPDQVNQICTECAQVADKAAPIMDLFDNITREDIMSIAMYTFAFSEGNPEANPYRRVNKALSEEDIAEFRNIGGLFYVLLASLRKVPRVSGITLYRGADKEMDLDEYKQGNKVTWSRFSSASMSMEPVKDFLGRNTSWSRNFAGTIFIIENGWGYDISRFSIFPDEEEVLLEPMREFEVKSVINQNGLVLISLKMLSTKIISLDPSNQSMTDPCANIV